MNTVVKEYQLLTMKLPLSIDIFEATQEEGEDLYEEIAKFEASMTKHF